MWNKSHRVAEAQKHFPNYQEGMMLIWDSGGLKEIKSFDYKPFGELDGGDKPTKNGFTTAEYDGESSCFAMGMRMYSAEFGRFLSVDPLFEAMPRHTPYHYSFNSPLVWKDPSGLAPEKEKDRDRLMTLYTYDVERAEAAYQGALVENNYKRMESMADAVASYLDLLIDWKNSPEARGGGGGGGTDGRTGGDGNGDNGSESNASNGSDGNKANSNGVSKEPTPWEHKGIYYETAEALVAATQGPHHYFIPPDGIPHYDNPGIVCEGKSDNSPLYFLMESAPDLTFTIVEVNLGKMSIGNNGKIYYSALTKGKSPFYGNQYTKVVMGEKIGKIGGRTFYFLTMANDINSLMNNEITAGRFVLNSAALLTALRVGGYPGFFFGLAYEGLMYEFHDSRHQYFTYPTGNNNHMPSDNTKVRKIIK